MPIRDGRNTYFPSNARPFGQPRRSTPPGMMGNARAADAMARIAKAQEDADKRKKKAEEDRKKRDAEKRRRENERKLREALKREQAAKDRLKALRERKAELRNKAKDDTPDAPADPNSGGNSMPSATVQELQARIDETKEELRAARNERNANRRRTGQDRTARAGGPAGEYQPKDQGVNELTPKAARKRKQDEQAWLDALAKQGKVVARGPDGKIVGTYDLVDMLTGGGNTMYTPEELAGGGFNFTNPADYNAGVYDFENSNGVQFADDTGATGYWVGKNGKRMELTPKQIQNGWRPNDGEWHPYNATDWVLAQDGLMLDKNNQPVPIDKPVRLFPLQKQGAILVSDEGQTWIRPQTMGAFGQMEGGQSVNGTWKTPAEVEADIAALEKSDPDKLREWQNKLFQGGHVKNLTPGVDSFVATGKWDYTTATAFRSFLEEAMSIGASNKKDLDDVLAADIEYNMALAAANADGGGGGGGGGASSYSATDPMALKMYAQQAAKAVLGRLPTPAEEQAAVAQVQAAEATEGAKQAGAIVNVDPSARMVEYFRNSNPTEFGSKNIADAVGMFSKIIGEGGLLGSGLASNSIDMGGSGG